MSEYSVGRALSPASAGNLLDRAKADSLKIPFSEIQSEVDRLVGRFLESAADGKSVFALLGAGLAGNFTRLGSLSAHLKSWALRGFTPIAGLAAESAAFAGLERAWDRSKEYSFARGFPKYWAQAAIQLGCLKGLGHFGRAENLLTQHLLMDTGMVVGHQLGYALGWTLRPRGNWTEQMLEAEATNWSMKASLSLLHLAVPRLSQLEKVLQITVKGKSPETLGAPSPFLKLAPEGPLLSSEESFPTKEPAERLWLAMSSLDGKDGGSPRPSRWERRLRAWRSEKRRMAAVELGLEKAESARVSLEKRLTEDSSWEVRGASSVALGKIGDFRSTPALIQAFRNDPRAEVRESTAYALGIAGDPAAAPILIQAFREKLSSLALRYLEEERLKKSGQELRSRPQEERDDYLTEAVAVALGRIGTPEAIRELTRSLNHPHFLANISALEGLDLAKNLSEWEDIGFWVEKAERRFSADQEAMDRAIQKYMSDLPLSPAEQRKLDEANATHSALLIGLSILGRLRNPASSPLLLHLLENADVDFRVVAAHALAELQDPHSLSALERGLTHPTAHIRVAAILALAKKGDPLARAFLTQIMDPGFKTDIEVRDTIWVLRSEHSHEPKLLPGHAAKGPRGLDDGRYEKMGIPVRD